MTTTRGNGERTGRSYLYVPGSLGVVDFRFRFRPGSSAAAPHPSTSAMLPSVLSLACEKYLPLSGIYFPAGEKTKVRYVEEGRS